MQHPGNNRREGGSPYQVIQLILLFAIVHSALASWQAKELTRRLVGTRHRDGLYRLAFVLKSLVLVAWGTVAFVRLPDRELYRIPAPWSWLMRLAQLLPLGLMISAAHVVGFMKMTGLGPALDLLVGDDPVERQPAAQGPPLAEDGEMKAQEAFRFTRHPANLAPAPFFLLWPRMTVNRAVLAAVAVPYLIVGSLHEEYRLKRAYGAPYERYRQRVPFFLPRAGRR